MRKGVDPGSVLNPGSNPGSDPHSDPGSDPSSDPGSDPGSNPSSNPGSKFRYPLCLPGLPELATLAEHVKPRKH